MGTAKRGGKGRRQEGRDNMKKGKGKGMEEDGRAGLEAGRRI